jgi:WD40 repeat protein
MEMEAYTQALLELDPVYAEWAWQQKYTALEIEQELAALKAQVSKTTDLKPNFARSNLSNSSSVNSGYSTTDSDSPASEFTAREIDAENLSIETELPPKWKCVESFRGHKASVNSIAISPDGQTLASGSDDRTVSLWNVKTGKQIFTFFGQEAEVHAVAISPDGKKLVAGGFDRKITTWQLDTKALLRPFFYLNSPYSHSGGVSSLAFSRDRKILASASGDKTIRLWGGYTGECKRTLNGHSDTVWSIAISPDSQTLVSGSADKTIRVWSLGTFQQPRILIGHSNWVTSVAIAPNGNSVVSGSTDGTIKLWNLHTGELLRTLGRESTGVFSVAINPDGQTLASSNRKTIKLWNIKTGELIQTLSGCSPVIFSPDGQTLVSGAEGGGIKIWRQMLGSDESDFVLSREWWEVLGVDMDAHPQEVKRAYRRLARHYHPDLNPCASAISKMQGINMAYEEFLKQLSKAWL